MRWGLSWLVFTLVACGGDGSAGGGNGGDPLSPAEAASLCMTWCEHAVSCGWEQNAATCQTECEALADMFRGDGLSAWLDCEIAASCTTQNAGEVCYVQATGEVDARPVHDDYVSRCTALPTSCPGITLPGARICERQQVILFSDPYMTAHVMPCFELACAQISACLETNVLDAF